MKRSKFYIGLILCIIIIFLVSIIWFRSVDTHSMETLTYMLKLFIILGTTLFYASILSISFEIVRYFRYTRKKNKNDEVNEPNSNQENLTNTEIKEVRSNTIM